MKLGMETFELTAMIVGLAEEIREALAEGRDRDAQLLGIELADSAVALEHLLCGISNDLSRPSC